MFDSLRYDRGRPDYQQKLLDVSHLTIITLCYCEWEPEETENFKSLSSSWSCNNSSTHFCSVLDFPTVSFHK